MIRGEGFEIPFDKATGLIVNAKAGEQVIIEKGPFLNLYVNLNHLTGAEVRKMANHFTISDSDWKKTSFSYTEKENGTVKVALVGSYRGVVAEFDILISPKGELSVNYQTSGVPNGFLRETGLSFYLSDAIQHLDWKRKGIGIIIRKVSLPEMKVVRPFISPDRLHTANNRFKLGRLIRTTIIIGQMPVPIVSSRLHKWQKV